MELEINTLKKDLGLSESALDVVSLDMLNKINGNNRGHHIKS